MSDESEKINFDLSSIFQLKDVLSDFAVAETALAKHDIIILADQGTWKYALMNMSEYEQYLRLKSTEASSTDKQKLPSLVNGAGKRFFIDNYLKFKMDPQVDEEDLAKDFKGSYATLRSQVSRVRNIFKNGWQVDALKHIIESPKTDEAMCERTQWLLELENDKFNSIFEDTKLANNYKDWKSFGGTSDEWKKNFNMHPQAYNQYFSQLLGKEDMPLEKLDNKRFAFRCIEMLQENDALDDEALRILTDKDLCKDMFRCSGFPILSEVSFEGELTEEDTCRNGRQRFYNKKITEGKRAFVLSNHWYGPGKSMPDNRTPFQAWVLERSDKAKAAQSLR